ncbi:AraC family transcriptional regulator [Actinoplanes sp. SE50]|uniref:helix-turn-helix transcriptional regulator n=1 Tax=unclassified Actinoplanes TaxID=2626549 RepID=UPI00023EBFAE|nr:MULTISPECIES: helix-turn-helix transcriptional regulator [unclassified Actinoplanes]AEV87458.1 putative thc operon regulatory protein [Actinoplanes sp. SE50/110]ATO85860.1 AraC family transcriptional regulator [Actinoplanes sp. SE50]SLM03274.1 AraC family transcriptional regulator [Actinoplanes sp. SE50/110]
MIDEYAQARPVAPLRPHVAFYTGYRQRGVPPGRHRGLPSPYLTLILTLDEPLVITSHPDRGQPPGAYPALLGGLHLRPASITHDGRQSGVQVALHPLGCRALLGLPAAALAHLDIDPADLLGARFVAEARDRLGAAPDWPARFAVLDQMLISRLADHVPGDPSMAYAWSTIRRGPTSIADLAGQVGWSGRHLTNRFRAELGIRPKEAARIVRFDRARRALRPGVRLAALAAAHGYADQSHLVREFQAFAGCAPSQWLADEFGFVQAVAALDGHDGDHD